MNHVGLPPSPRRKAVLALGLLLSVLCTLWPGGIAQAAPHSDPAIVLDDGLPTDPVWARVAGREVRVFQDKTHTTIEDAEVPLADFMQAISGATRTFSTTQLVVNNRTSTLQGVSAELLVRTGRDGPRLLIDILDHPESRTVEQLLARNSVITLCFVAGGYRICIDIGWNRDMAPSLTVDGRPARINALEVIIDDEPATFAQLLDLVGTSAITPTVLSVQDARGNDLDHRGVNVRMRGRFQEVSGLGTEFAMHGSNTVCFGLGPWRICITIEWDRELAPLARVDGQALELEDLVIQLGGDELFLPQLARLAGREPYHFDQATLTSLIDNENITTWEATWERGVFVLQNNTQQESRALRLLAREGKAQLTLRNDDDDLDVTMTLLWPSPDVLLEEFQVRIDGREVLVDGEPTVEIDGERVDLARGVEALGPKPVNFTELEIRMSDGTTVTVPNSYAVMPGDNIKFIYGLANLIAEQQRIAEVAAAAVKIEICTTIGKVKICIPITIGKKREPKVVLLESSTPLSGAAPANRTGRPVPVVGAQAWIDDVPVDLLRITGFGSFENQWKVEEGESLQRGTAGASSMSAEIHDGVIYILGADEFVQEFAFRGATICFEVVEFGYRWRICVTVPRFMTDVPGGGRIELPDYDVHGALEVEVEDGELGEKPQPTSFTFEEIKMTWATDEGGRTVDGLGKPFGLLLPAVQRAVALAQAPTVDDYFAGRWDDETGAWVELPITLDTANGMINIQVDRFGEIGLFVRDQSETDPEDDPEDTTEEVSLYLPAIVR